MDKGKDVARKMSPRRSTTLFHASKKLIQNVRSSVIFNTFKKLTFDRTILYIIGFRSELNLDIR